jgi:hypothetical protein
MKKASLPFRGRGLFRSGQQAGRHTVQESGHRAVGLACKAGGDGSDAIAGKPAPTSCLRSHDYVDGCRGLFGSWLASDRALPGAPCGRACTEQKRQLLPQAACAAMTTLMAAEVCVGAGLPAIGLCQAPHAVGHLPSRKTVAFTSCLRSHDYVDGCRGLFGSWLASDRALPGAPCGRACTE